MFNSETMWFFAISAVQLVVQGCLVLRPLLSKIQCDLMASGKMSSIVVASIM